MKKFICTLLGLILSVQAVFAAGDTVNKIKYDEEKLTQAAFVLNRLGITELQEDAEIWENNTLSRAEFADMLSKAFKLERNSDTVYNMDVPRDMWAFDAIGVMVETGCVSIPEDKYFRPDDTITFAEALKMILSAAKYDIYAEYNGGFPYGYINAAQRMKLGISADFDAELTMPAAVTLVYEVMSMGYYEPRSYSETEAVPYKETEELIMGIV